MRERLRRFWRELRAGWRFWLCFVLYCFALILTAIDPLVNPHMPDTGRGRLFAAIPLSYHLLKGGVWQHILFALICLPWAALILWLPRFPRWRREQREWERKAIIRRARDKQRRANKRAMREADAAKEEPAGDSAPL